MSSLNNFPTDDVRAFTLHLSRGCTFTSVQRLLPVLKQTKKPEDFTLPPDGRSVRTLATHGKCSSCFDRRHGRIYSTGLKSQSVKKHTVEKGSHTVKNTFLNIMIKFSATQQRWRPALATANISPAKYSLLVSAHRSRCKYCL